MTPGKHEEGLGDSRGPLFIKWDIIGGTGPPIHVAVPCTATELNRSRNQLVVMTEERVKEREDAG